MFKVQRFFIATLILILSSSLTISAQEKKNLLKTSLIMPIGNTFELAWERCINNNISFQIGGGAGDLNYGYGQFRYYLSENMSVPSGPFVSPFLLFSDEPSGGGINVGYQRLYKGKISLEAYIGPFITNNGVIVWGGINIGFAF